MPWLTPETLPTTFVCRQVLIPENVDIIAAVTGALLDLTRASNWEQHGAITPEEISAAMAQMVMEFWEGCTERMIEPTFLVDKKAQNVDGGGTTLGSWQTRVLNTIEGNLFNGISLASNVFTLPAGRWLVRWSCPAYECGQHQTRLFDTTGSSVVRYGTAEQGGASTDAQTRSIGVWSGLINAPNNFRIEHRSTGTKATLGFGVAANLAEERYTIVEIFPLAA